MAWSAECLPFMFEDLCLILRAHIKKKKKKAKHGGICLWPQCWGGRDRWTRGAHWPASLLTSDLQVKMIDDK